MTVSTDWPILGPDLDTILAASESPLDDLAAGRIPAIVLRNAWPVASCQRLIKRLIDDELLYDRTKPIPDKFAEESIPEGYFSRGHTEPTSAWETRARVGKNRIDIGTSLGYRGSDPDEFFAHAEETHALYDGLFTDDDPIRLLYDTLTTLSRNKQAVTAHEPDGRRYGPAIIRAHYGGYTYAPHFDSVRLREKREDYAVHEFEHQFAGVLVLQNTTLEDRTAQCRLHRCLWTEEVGPYLDEGRFHDYARDNDVENVEVCLKPGDLYFFNTRGIHEVPGVAGDLPRIVLATFIGYSQDRGDIFVWS